MTETVQSADGTTIAYERTGTGEALILIGGAFSTRVSAGAIAELLSPHFTVFAYDRRGRGDSGDLVRYAIEREVSDVDALITAAGGTAHVYGHSSGAMLALEAACRGSAIAKLAAYEPPYTAAGESASGDAAADEPADKPADKPAGSSAPDVAERVQAALDAGEPEQAAEIFMRFTGESDESIQGVKQAPFWPEMVAIAHTLPYDLALLGDGTVPDRFRAITATTLVLDGGSSPAWAARAAAAVAGRVPGARRRTLEGQQHGADNAVLAPVLVDFFQS